MLCGAILFVRSDSETKMIPLIVLVVCSTSVKYLIYFSYPVNFSVAVVDRTIYIINFTTYGSSILAIGI